MHVFYLSASEAGPHVTNIGVNDMKPNHASAGCNGFSVLFRTARAAGWIVALLLTVFVCHEIAQNINEQQKWHNYVIDNNCYISSNGEKTKAFDERGGRLATKPAPKVWSCDNGLNFTRY